MKHVLFWLYTAFWLTLASLPTQAQEKPLVISVVGDSLTSGYQLAPEEGFASVLQEKLDREGFKAQVLARSIAGETLSGVRERLDELLKDNPDIVLLAVGTNDVKRGLSLEVIHNNYKEIITAFQKRGVYVMVTTVSGATQGKKYARELEKIYENFVEGKKILLYRDTLQGVAGQANKTLADGLHPNAAGVRVMVERMYPSIYYLLRWRMNVLAKQRM